MKNMEWIDLLFRGTEDSKIGGINVQIFLMPLNFLQPAACSMVGMQRNVNCSKVSLKYVAV